MGDIANLAAILFVLLVIGFCAALPSGGGVHVKPLPKGPRPKPAPIAPAPIAPPFHYAHLSGESHEHQGLIHDHVRGEIEHDHAAIHYQVLEERWDGNTRHILKAKVFGFDGWVSPTVGE